MSSENKNTMTAFKRSKAREAEICISKIESYSKKNKHNGYYDYLLKRKYAENPVAGNTKTKVIQGKSIVLVSLIFK